MASAWASDDSRCETITQRPAVGDLAEMLLDDGLALGVEGAGRLVEDQQPRPRHQRAGDRDALALAAREVGAALLDHGVVCTAAAGR